MEVISSASNETVYNLVQKYDIVEYGKTTDTWQVKLKESEG